MSEFVTRDSIREAEAEKQSGTLSDFAKRLPLNYNSLPLNFLTVDDFNFIEIKAKALSLDEIFDYLGIDQADIPSEELIIANKAWKRGRVNGIATAADKLFTSMSDKNGGSIAMEYLRQLSNTFHLSPDQSSSSGNNFSFKVVLDEQSV